MDKPLHTYYYTFGTDPLFPHQNGWVEVIAASWPEAHSKFRAVYPDRHPNVLNCAFFYEEDRWQKINPPKNWPGYKCYGTIE